MDHTNNSCCCGEAEHFSGCLICGASITYRAESSIQTCSICHKEQLTNAVCENSHFICDACHSYGTYAPVIAALRDSTEKDALLLLEKIMDLPSVHMHGPEHHVMVGAALLTAYKNAGGAINLRESVMEMLNRGKAVPGGTCGFWGACGAGISAGMFVSILSGATPLTEESWGLSNQMTSKALEAISRTGGPRCCKRDSYLAILAAVDFVKTHFGIEMECTEVQCTHYAQNNQCIGKRCPFWRFDDSI